MVFLKFHPNANRPEMNMGSVQARIRGGLWVETSTKMFSDNIIFLHAAIYSIPLVYG